VFTSTLSVNEFALLGRLGPQPLAQVMGASVVRTGWQYLPALTPGQAVVTTGFGYRGAYGPSVTGWALNNRFTEASPSQIRSYLWHTPVVCELDVLTAAWNSARRQALDRLAGEALEAGADAVVGVTVQRGDHDLGKGVIEYLVSGTAIRLPGSTGDRAPVLTSLSVQDYWRLHTAGHDAGGFLGATVVAFASAPRSTRLRRARTQAQNQELEELSDGFHLARDGVRTRLRGQVMDARGWGAVGVQFAHSVARGSFHLASSIQTADHRGWNRGRLGLPYYVSGHSDVERAGWVITMHALGTAINQPRGQPATPIKPAIRMGTP
jgi:uncharacterized protein YbjQ (UPF0145 family)